MEQSQEPNRTLFKGKQGIKNNAMGLVILLGIVSLFSDITYEGARSVTGPYLAFLGANAAVVGVVAGFGEMIGYGIRLISGYVSDKTGSYWTITIIGYIVNLFAVPLLAIAGRWELAVALIIGERMGKAIRTPARDVMLSHATSEIGRGWGFGFHEAMDQTGALLGPLIISGVLYFKGGYQQGFAFLLIPAVLAVTCLLLARKIYPSPEQFEQEPVRAWEKGYPKVFWIYLIAVALLAAGYADFALIAYHFKKISLLSEYLIPVIYSTSMGVAAISALIFGKLFDKIGISTMVLTSLLSSMFAPLVFLGSIHFAIFGIVLWGMGMGTQESIMRAAIAGMISKERRGTAYGVFNTSYGIFWFMGSSLMGFLYEKSLIYLVMFSVISQLASIPFFFLAKKRFSFTTN